MSCNDPRGPVRKIVAVDARADFAYVTLDCGHVRQFNSIYHYTVGTDARCLACKHEQCS